MLHLHSHCDIVVHDAEVAARREVEDGGMREEHRAERKSHTGHIDGGRVDAARHKVSDVSRSVSPEGRLLLEQKCASRSVTEAEECYFEDGAVDV